MKYLWKLKFRKTGEHHYSSPWNEMTVRFNRGQNWLNDSSAKLSVILFAMLLAIVFGAYLASFYPGPNSTLGADHPLFFVRMASAEFHFRQENWFSVPWFTPAMCAGSLQFANPIDVTYSLPQLLSMMFDPLVSAYVTHLVFTLIGGLGTYLLCRSEPFDLHYWPAVAGGAFMAFNGFYMSRMITGHTNFHVFMLVPVITWLMFQRGWHSVLVMGVLAGLVLPGGGVHVVIPMAASILMVVLIAKLYQKSHNWKHLISRGSASFLIAFCLSASKLGTILALISNFPRDLYRLQGIDSLEGSLRLPLQSLLWHWTDRPEGIVGDWRLAAQEFDYSLSPAMGICLLCATWMLLIRYRYKMRRLCFWVLVFIVLIPIGVNYHHPDWSEFLKTIPLISSNVSLFRWYAMYLLPLCLIAAITLDRLPNKRMITPLCIFVILTIVGWQIARQPAWKNLPTVDYPILQHGLARAREEGVTPISRIDTELNSKNQPARVHASRDVRFTEGSSQVFCYDALFGYRNELLRIDNLRVGPVNLTIGDEYNLKNPACYPYPDANDCVAGDNFRLDQTENMLKFSGYRAWDFKLPLYQRLANLLSTFSWLALLFFALYILMSMFLHRARACRRHRPGG
jgi:hypothetical protein